MIIIPSFCAQSYAYNGRVEEKVANYLASITGLQVKDYSKGKRPEYDFQIGDDRGFVQVELKTTGSKYIPVETHKDEARTIESGLMTSTSPLVATISVGIKTGFGEVGKLRVFTRSSLMQQAGRTGRGRFYASANQSEGSYSYSFIPPSDSVHAWLGDIPIVYVNTGSEDRVVGYDLDAIFDDRGRVGELMQMINKFRGIEDE